MRNPGELAEPSYFHSVDHPLVIDSSVDTMPSFTTPTVVLVHYLNSVTQAPAKMQHDVLASILQANAQCEYLRSLGLDGRTDAESFRSCVPISTYDTIKHHLARIAKGDNSELPLDTPGQGVLCSSPIVELIAR